MVFHACVGAKEQVGTMDIDKGDDRRLLVFSVVFAPLTILVIAGLIIPDRFDDVLLAVFPGVTVVYCANTKLAWFFAGILGSVVYYTWLAITSMQWLGYALAVVWAMRRGKLKAILLTVALAHLAAVGAAALVMHGLRGQSE